MSSSSSHQQVSLNSEWDDFKAKCIPIQLWDAPLLKDTFFAGASSALAMVIPASLAMSSFEDLEAVKKRLRMVKGDIAEFLLRAADIPSSG